ncbi:MAG: malto-oligosyltrehalose synthase [Acidobacteria bacterium]|nr:malto-oligosyltrehalose synthase [Acidobacteriota bacterium]
MATASDIPLSIYRLQFNRHFTFRDATQVVPYLAALGITHCYASPYLRARPGSMHGYDIIDHNSLNPEIGTREDYETFVTQLHRHGLGQILDIVPNHMGVMGADNNWWLDVLENGEASMYAEFFDIDWSPIKEELEGKVLVPVLADQYGNVLEQGELKLVFDAERGEFSIYYHQHRFPINPREYPRILHFEFKSLETRLGPTHDDVLELESIATAFGHLPTRQHITAEKTAERNREKEIQKRRLAALCARSIEIADFLQHNVQILNGTRGEPRSFDALHELIKAQAYRLAQWRVAADDINYRRFFDINDLAAIRTENPEVFSATHRLVMELVAEGKVNGLRIDHPDGLYDPARYFRELQENVKGKGAGALYVVAEKILTGKEHLRQDWPISGTTGYEFANLVNGLFVDPTTATRMDRIYRSFVGSTETFDNLVYNSKRLIVKISLASELNVLANALSRIALANRHTCDFTLNNLRSALAEIIACFPVYRTYVANDEVSPQDRQYIEQAVRAGARRSNLPDLTVFDFIRKVLLIESNGDEPRWYRNAFVRFTMKFQQVTSAVMAKGLEDTAFYRYNRLLSLNEVGADPITFGVSVDEFHRANFERGELWPHSVLAGSTHDSKRSEDVRARINVLSEMPAQWRASLRRWRDWNRSRKRTLDGALAPDRNDEYLLYETLIGAWPLTVEGANWSDFVDRIQGYMLKAIREAKQHSSWANPHAEYEQAVEKFVQAILERKRRNRFLHDFEQFESRIARIGFFNSLSHTLLKLTCPGVPDIYQGNELWEYSLVDPDNRRPVDYVRRQELLGGLSEQGPDRPCMQRCRAHSLLNSLEDGRAKLFLISTVLNYRRHRATFFHGGRYLSLTAHGPRAHHLCAFAREFEGQVAMVVVPRLCATLLGDKHEAPLGAELWDETYLQIPGEIGCRNFLNVLTGEELQVETRTQGRVLPAIGVLASFPVALLASQPERRIQGGKEGLVSAE